MLGLLAGAGLQTAGGLLNSLPLGKWLGTDQSFEDVATGVSKGIDQIGNSALELGKKAAEAGAYSAGWGKKSDYDMMSDRYKGSMGAQESSALQDMKDSAQRNLSNVGLTSQLALNSMQNTNRNNMNTLKSMSSAMGPASMAGAARALGDSSSQAMNQFFNSAVGATERANAQFGEMMANVNKGTIAAKDLNNSMFVKPYEQQRDQSIANMIGSVTNNGMNTASSQYDQLITNPAAGLTAALGQMGQDGMKSSMFISQMNDPDFLSAFKNLKTITGM